MECPLPGPGQVTCSRAVTPADCGNSVTVSPNNRRLNTWLMQVPYTFFGTNVNHQPQIRGFHHPVRSTAVSQIGIELQEIHQLLEMEATKKKGKVHWLLDNEPYIFEKKDVEAGIICPLVGIMLIFVLRHARSHTLAATLPPPLTTAFSRRTNPWAFKIGAFWRKCHPSSSV